VIRICGALIRWHRPKSSPFKENINKTIHFTQKLGNKEFPLLNMTLECSKGGQENETETEFSES